MQGNVGRADAWIRAFLGLGALVVAGLFNDRPAVSLIAVAVALICFGTALTKECPIYRLLGFGTRKQRNTTHQ